MVFVGFRDTIGRTDVTGVIKHIDQHKGEYSNVYILHRKPLYPTVEQLINDAGFKHTITNNFNEEIDKIKEKDEVKVYDLDDFGERPLTRDIF